MMVFKYAPLFSLRWNRGFFLSVALLLMSSMESRAQNTALVFSKYSLTPLPLSIYVHSV